MAIEKPANEANIHQLKQSQDANRNQTLAMHD